MNFRRRLYSPRCCINRAVPRTHTADRATGQTSHTTTGVRASLYNSNAGLPCPSARPPHAATPRAPLSPPVHAGGAVRWKPNGGRTLCVVAVPSARWLHHPSDRTRHIARASTRAPPLIKHYLSPSMMVLLNPMQTRTNDPGGGTGVSRATPGNNAQTSATTRTTRSRDCTVPGDLNVCVVHVSLSVCLR